MYMLSSGRPSHLTGDAKKDGLPPLQRIAWSDARRLLKPHIGFEAFLAPLAALVEEFADELGAGGYDLDAARESLRLVKIMEAELRAVEDRAAALRSTILVHNSSAWTHMLLAYDRLKSGARTNGIIRGGIDPFRRFMRTGRRKTPPKP